MEDDGQASVRAARDRQAVESLLACAAGEPSDVARAIKLAEDAVTVHCRTGPPTECATSWYVLGTAWWVRKDGSRDDNLDRALDAMMHALHLRLQVGPRVEWARVIANMGAIYWQRTNGRRGDDIERAIHAWRAASEVFDIHASAEHADGWIAANENLATAYVHRAVGDRARNVGAAVATLEAIADFYRDRQQPDGWARTQNRLGNTLLEHPTDVEGANVERAIDIFSGVLCASEVPEEIRTATEGGLALAYMRRVQGDAQQNVTLAMRYCWSVLERSSVGNSPEVALAHNTLGAALLAVEPTLASDVDAAVEHLRTAVSLFRDRGPHREYAKAQFNLAHALSRCSTGDADDNREQAIAAWLEAGRSYRHAMLEDNAPADFSATIANATGTAYIERVRGDRGDNIEHAIVHFHSGILDFPKDSTDELLAATRHNLGNAYIERLLGDRVENLNHAREALESAGRVRTRARSPLDWALTQMTLGVAYAKLAELVDDGRLTEMAIEAHQGALEVLEPERRLTDWQRAQCNLAAALLQSVHGNRSENETRAIAAFEAVLETTPQPGSDLSAVWFSACYGLGEAYRRRDGGRHGDDIPRAVDAWRACLDEDAGSSSPGLRHRCARSLGDLLSELGRWDEAAVAYVLALEATDNLYRASFLADSQRYQLESSGDTFVRAAYAMVRSDPSHLGEALLLLEQGRARSLAEQMSYDGVARTAARSGDSELHRSYTETLASLRKHEAILRDGLAVPWAKTLIEREPSNKEPPDFVDDENSRRVGERLLADIVSNAKARLDVITEQIGHAATDVGRSAAGLDLTDLVPATLPDVPVAYLVCTPFGSLFFLLSYGAPRPTVDSLRVDEFTESDLHRVLGLSRRNEGPGPPGYLMGQLGAESPMKAYVQELLTGLGERLIEPLADWLTRHGANGVVLVPTGRLGLLPLHAVPIRGRSGPCLLDDFDVSYAPSAGALKAAREAVPERERAPRRLVGVADPSEDRPLRWARAELIEVAGQFREPIVCYGAAATKPALTEPANSASYVHVACHGRYDMADPLSSGLELADGVLSIRDLIRDRPFAAARLVVASACQTAVTEFMRLPDEVFGLPTAFLTAGTPAVIGTLWPVDDLSTALLVAQFYRFHLEGGSEAGRLAPAAALRRAQLWLRDLTGTHLPEAIRAMPQLLTIPDAAGLLAMAAEDPAARIYFHPSYWAPFVLIGA